MLVGVVFCWWSVLVGVGGWCCVGSFFGTFFVLGTGTTQRKGGRQHDDQKEEAMQLHTQRRRGKTAPPNGKRRDHHSTELN